MRKMYQAFIIALLLVSIGCSNSIDENEVAPSELKTQNFHFTGTIEEIINENGAIVHDGQGNILVNLSVNKNETFQVGDKVKVGYDGVILESSPAQINTLSVERIEE